MRYLTGVMVAMTATVLTGHAFALPFYTTLSANASSTQCADIAGSCATFEDSDPESASQAGTLDSMALNSIAALPGVTAFQNITATFSSANQGVVTYNDGWDIASMTNAGVSFPARSSYLFSLTTPGSLDLLWSLSETGIPVSGQMFCCSVSVDGVQLPVPIGSSSNQTGFFSVNLPLRTDNFFTGVHYLSPATHLLEFWDFSNVHAGGTGSIHTAAESNASFAFTIHGTIGGDALFVPEPPTFALIALALAAAAAFILSGRSGTDRVNRGLRGVANRAILIAWEVARWDGQLGLSTRASLQDAAFMRLNLSSASIAETLRLRHTSCAISSTIS